LLSKTNPAYRDLYKGIDKKFWIVTGGRGAAKTFELTKWLMRLSFKKGHVILYTRYTLDNAFDSVIPEFIDKIEREGMQQFFQVNKKDIVNKLSGSVVKFRGIKAQSGNQTAKLKGIKGLSTFVMDEGEEWRVEDDYEKLSQSVRQTEVKNRVIIIMNPADATHFIWDRYFKDSYKTVNIDGFDVQVSTHPDVHHIHTTYFDNLAHLPQDFIDEAQRMKERNPEKYAHIYLGKWQLQPEGAIFTDWIEEDFNNELPYIFGMDFGWSPDPTVLVKVALDKKNYKLYVKCLYYEKEQDTKQILNNLSKHCERNQLIVADLAEPRIINEVYEAGFNIVECEKGPGSVRAGIKDIQAFTICVESNDIFTKFELNNYIWNNKRAGVPVDANNHIIDAMRYAFVELTQKTGLAIA